MKMKTTAKKAAPKHSVAKKTASKNTKPPSEEKKHRIYTMTVASVYPHYVTKAEKKGRKKAEVDAVICWLTGYSPKELKEQLKKGTNFEDFFAEAPKMNPARSLITGTICGVRIEEIEDPLMREIRYLDKLVDELAKGKAMEKILRVASLPAMTLQDFAKMTINVIRKDGLDGYLPTFVLPDTQEIRAIEGIPDDVDHRDAVQKVIRRSGYKTREFFFGVQCGPRQITVGHFRPGQPTEFMKITSTRSGYSASILASCAWWRVP